jgi:hypothetical protein
MKIPIVYLPMTSPTSESTRESPIVLTIGRLTLADLRSVVQLIEHPIRDYAWTHPAAIAITANEGDSSDFEIDYGCSG